MSKQQILAEPTQESGLEETKAFLLRLHENQTPIEVRRLIGFWGMKGRGKHQVEVIQTNLEEMKLTTEPPFDSGPLDSLVRIERLADVVELSANTERPDDHLLTLARIPSANFAIRQDDSVADRGFVPRDRSVDEAVTTMLRFDYSQLPVVHSAGDRAVVGIFSWEAYARARLRGVSPLTVGDVMVPVAPVDLHSDLFASVGPIADRGFVVVTYRGLLSGIVTASDLTQEFQKLTIPFLAVGRCEQELKRVANVALPAAKGRPVDDFMFGQLQRHYETHWDLLNWSLSKSLFLEWLNSTRELRNSIAHFDNQDVDRSSEIEDVHRLTDWLRFVAPVDESLEFEGKKVG